MIYTYIATFLLIAACSYFIYQQKKIHKTYTRLIEAKGEEAAGEIALKEEEHKEQTEAILSKEKQKYEIEIQELMEQRNSDVSKLNSYIRMIERFSRNSGEVMTHNILLELKSDMIQSGTIRNEEMRILGNVFIPYYSENNELRTRQIDHLIILPTGIYVIETKYWKGKVLHGLTKEKTKEFAFIMETLFPNSRNDEEETLVFVHTQDNERDQKAEMRIVSYDNPAKQVGKTVHLFKRYLQGKQIAADWIVPIVYFAYRTNEFNAVVDYSTDVKTQRFTSKKELYRYFSKEVMEKRQVYNISDIEEIKAIVEDANVLQ